MENGLYVNVASGYLVEKGFVNIDNSLYFKLSKIYPLVKPFLSAGRREFVDKFIQAEKEATLVLGNCKERLDFKDNSVDHILCSHFLEHIFHDEAYTVMEEFYRILKPGASVHIILPDIELQMKEYLARSEDEAIDDFMAKMLQYGKESKSFLRRFLDVLGMYGLDHLWMYDNRSIRAKLKRIGYRIEDDLETPSAGFRQGDDSIHVIAVK